VTLISILGPTSSGKSEMAVKLAQYLDHKYGKSSAVIISCDSRQVYKDLNIGTGKIEGKWVDNSTYGHSFEYKNIPHFLIDYVDANQKYSLNQFLFDFNKLFSQWNSLPKFVILCGGTGLFAKAVFEDYKLDLIDPDYENEYEKYRKELNGLNATHLQLLLNSLNFDYLKGFNYSDQNNPRRLISKILSLVSAKNNWLLESSYPTPKFDLKWQFYLEPENIKERIELRLEQRLKDGIVEETAALIQSGKLQIEKLFSLGLEYEEFYYYFYGLTTYDEYTKGLLRQNLSYLKRQKTWFKKQDLLVKVDALEEILKITKL